MVIVYTLEEGKNHSQLQWHFFKLYGGEVHVKLEEIQKITLEHRSNTNLYVNNHVDQQKKKLDND